MRGFVITQPSYLKDKEAYLFQKIEQAKKEAKRKNPEKKILDLGLGDTTLPLCPSVSEAIQKEAIKLQDPSSYTGYETAFGREILRKKIAQVIYQDKISADEIFLSDGSKCDVARMQHLFDRELPIALQDPVYPAYLGSSLLSGKKQISFLPCTKENNFTPDLSGLKEPHLIYICSPNNPTGHVLTRKDLEKIVFHTLRTGSLLFFDRAYADFIQDKKLPSSIFEIEEAKNCAIESGSFSKSFGFTGIRLGYLVVPQNLTYADQSSIQEAWKKIVSTLFNGASNLAQAAGLAALAPQAIEHQKVSIQHYLSNSLLLKKSIKQETFGAEHIPYVWINLNKESSFSAFSRLLEKGIVSTPGVGFGPSGEGFLRLSGFAKKESCLEAAELLRTL